MEENGLLQTGGGGGVRIHVRGGECHQEGEDHAPESVPEISHQTATQTAWEKSLRAT